MDALDLLQPMLLGMDWMDPNWLLDQFGQELFWISLLIIFVECGLFFPFLPGDTLLFAMGLFIAGEKVDILPADEFIDLTVCPCAVHGLRLLRQRRRLRDRPLDRTTAL